MSGTDTIVIFDIWDHKTDTTATFDLGAVI